MDEESVYAIKVSNAYVKHPGVAISDSHVTVVSPRFFLEER